MSIQAVGWALDQDLPARPKLVLVSLANHADKTTGYCWLNAETIAQEASCKARSVYRFIAALARNGYVRREKRRGADGKQRANDYWLLLDRQPAPWVEIGQEPEESETDAESHGSDDGDIQDVDGAEGDRVSSVSPGESDSQVTRQDDKLPAPSLGPGDSGVSHIDSAEPSKINPENGPINSRTPRGYRRRPPGAPQPMGATTLGGTGENIFVYAGTPAYKAWIEHRSSELGRKWIPPSATKNGQLGWYFPTLFPPSTADPPKVGEQANDIDNPFEKTG